MAVVSVSEDTYKKRLKELLIKNNQNNGDQNIPYMSLPMDK